MMPKTSKVEDLIAKYTADPVAKAAFDQGKARLMADHEINKARKLTGLSIDLAAVTSIFIRNLFRK
ncbi:hypothetical protein [Lacticaseibacillus chiayiensis]|uniref:hypothetical protein n=1 Tax=Lacticaseibacillus chiayiensis TaxID=2100821 RepID=UPI001013A9BF|nr:hypothetical protein [Lacticaseibacillus chiayiensis]RXT57996.1 hypothetical protein CHT97_09170 [Lacticaseibacillus chiayiensis]